MVEGRRNEAFRQVTNQSFLSVADGKPVFWVGRAKGARGIGHAPGPDFFLAAIRRFAGRAHYFYGSTPEVLAQLEVELRRRHPDLRICGMFSPPFRQLDRQDLEQHYEAIRASGAEFVWVGLGAPKQ